jgi:hypothetical protein
MFADVEPGITPALLCRRGSVGGVDGQGLLREAGRHARVKPGANGESADIGTEFSITGRALFRTTSLSAPLDRAAN